ncbi:MAG: DUF1232 domain-containing protein [Candidatus Rokuibacteriota bacterium]
MKDLALLVPRLARMVAAIVRDPDVPSAAKVALGALALYLASPIDLIPDLIPFLGYVDDLLLAAVVLDGVLGLVDRSILLRYWPGSPSSLEATARVAHRLSRWVPPRIKARIFSR